MLQEEDVDEFGGVIRKEFTIDCATCSNMDLLPGREMHHVENEARRRGWSETGAFGWICKECVKKDRDSLTFWKPNVPSTVVTQPEVVPIQQQKVVTVLQPKSRKSSIVDKKIA